LKKPTPTDCFQAVPLPTALNHPAAAVVPASLLLFGAGGHGRVVADAALASMAWVGVVGSDRDALRCTGELVPGVPLLRAGDAALANIAGIHIAIGNNAAREKEAAAWVHARLATVMHPAAMVSALAEIGAGCFVAAGAIVGPGARLGIGVIVNHGAVVDHDVQLGAFCHVAPNATLGGAVHIGRRVLVGASAVVLPGNTIADDVVIGAGAVVIAPLLEAGTYVGVPARKIQ
jgi:sugar O-acyltransferase (sialic acid O-acetyltransferase NeuD family)